VGNCSESFSDCNGPLIHNYLRIVLQMAMVLAFKSKKKIVKIGRVAGQFAKPRSSNYEEINGKKILSYRGDNVNSFEADPKQRIPDPKRLLEGYFRSAATLNLIRAFTQGGYSNIKNIASWKEHFFVDAIKDLDLYKTFESEVTQSLEAGNNLLTDSNAEQEIYISHEALLLNYEEAFTRLDTVAGGYYSTSAHNLWIGDRTRQLNSAHIEYVSGIGNPIGIKIGPDYNLDEFVEVLNKINPNNEEGKIIVIVRMGAKKIAEHLPAIIEKIKSIQLNVIWSCDPMHGNSFMHQGFKVRDFGDIVSETKQFFNICKSMAVIPGGIHLEITGEYVSECIGGLNGQSLSNIGDKYDTKVDPRLNAAQALEFAFILSDLIAENS
jgi:3-deoxy-7-phosphoheptulonate synthase